MPIKFFVTATKVVNSCNTHLFCRYYFTSRPELMVKRPIQQCSNKFGIVFGLHSVALRKVGGASTKSK